MELSAWSQLPSAARWILTAELFLGGQGRLTDRLTPLVHERIMQKAEGYQRYLSFIPARNAKEHTVFIGSLMSMAGGLLCFSNTRLQGALLSMSLSVAGIYSQYKMGVAYWVPRLNTALAALIIYSDVGKMK